MLSASMNHHIWYIRCLIFMSCINAGWARATGSWFFSDTTKKYKQIPKICMYKIVIKSHKTASKTKKKKKNHKLRFRSMMTGLWKCSIQNMIKANSTSASDEQSWINEWDKRIKDDTLQLQMMLACVILYTLNVCMVTVWWPQFLC